MLLLPLAMVPIGLALGKLVALLSGSLVRPQDHWIVVCATAFPNSISLPTVLLTVVQEILYRGGAAVPRARHRPVTRRDDRLGLPPQHRRRTRPRCT